MSKTNTILKNILRSTIILINIKIYCCDCCPSCKKNKIETNTDTNQTEDNKNKKPQLPPQKPPFPLPSKEPFTTLPPEDTHIPSQEKIDKEVEEINKNTDTKDLEEMLKNLCQTLESSKDMLNTYNNMLITCDDTKKNTNPYLIKNNKIRISDIDEYTKEIDIKFPNS